jgi:hypothetical protein
MWKEKWERSEQRNRNLASAIQRLEAEAVRLRKILVDSWGDVPGEHVYTKDTKEIHYGDT